MSILIADDDSTSRLLLQKMLETMGYSVTVTDDGAKAWEEYLTNHPRMIISDWIMPKMSGLELCRKIRENPWEKYTYIVIVTSKSKTVDLVEALDAGADDYISKPFNPEELRARLKNSERILKLEESHQQAVRKIEETQTQILQSEKMASIGQLAAGVAHEINNPIGFVGSNLRTLGEYHRDLKTLITRYRDLVKGANAACQAETWPADLVELLKEIETCEADIDIDYIQQDIDELIDDCLEGTERIRKIVLDLKDFAHPGEDKPKVTDIHNCIESTLNVVHNELKYKATIVKNLGELPVVQCYPHQINQVLMNILVNAAQAIEKTGEIKIETRPVEHGVEICISDTGSGIPQENLTRIFDPFFTTKDVGKGTGLGMNIAYNIIKKHHGTIEVKSTVGKGTQFTIRLPLTLPYIEDME